MAPRIQRGLSSYAAPWVKCGATSAPADVAPRCNGHGWALRGETGPDGGVAGGEGDGARRPGGLGAR
eukprot:2725855-Pyramimonas_sp.AAC.1